MTEEIIVDGVNIAGCPCLYDDNFKNKCTEPYYDVHHGQIYQIKNCTDNPNCYYKQRKRLEQENKELKAELNKVIDEREKKIEETLLKGCYQSLGSECRIYELKESKYRSALEEINILAKNYCNACDEFKAKTYKNKNDCLYCNYGFIKRKINEVLK